jgi:hypothetical protein
MRTPTDASAVDAARRGPRRVSAVASFNRGEEAAVVFPLAVERLEIAPDT